MDDATTALFDMVRSLALPPAHYAIFGSGPLIVRRIVAPANDIDILSRGPAWDRAKSLGETRYLADYGVEIVSCYGGRVTIGTRWAIGRFDTDELIDTAEVIDGLPFVRLPHVIAYKRISDREKDRAHLRLLDAAGAAGRAPPGTERAPGDW